MSKMCNRATVQMRSPRPARCNQKTQRCFRKGDVTICELMLLRQGAVWWFAPFIAAEFGQNVQPHRTNAEILRQLYCAASDNLSSSNARVEHSAASCGSRLTICAALTCRAKAATVRAASSAVYVLAAHLALICSKASRLTLWLPQGHSKSRITLCFSPCTRTMSAAVIERTPESVYAPCLNTDPGDVCAHFTGIAG